MKSMVEEIAKQRIQDPPRGCPAVERTDEPAGLIYLAIRMADGTSVKRTNRLAEEMKGDGTDAGFIFSCRRSPLHATFISAPP